MSENFSTLLLHGYRSKFDDSDRYSIQAGRVELVATLSALAAVFSSDTYGTYSLALISFALGVVAWSLKNKSADAKQSGDLGRRAYLLVDSLAFKLAGKERTDLLERLGLSANLGDQPLPVPKYFASGKETGVERLLHNLQESAFYTMHLAKAARDEERLSILGFGLCGFFILVGCTLTPATDLRLRVAQCCLLVMSVLFTRDHVGRASAFEQSRNFCELTDERLNGITLDGLSPDEKTAKVSLILGDYNAMTASTPVISGKLHKKHNARLNDLWNQRNEI